MIFLLFLSIQLLWRTIVSSVLHEFISKSFPLCTIYGRKIIRHAGRAFRVESTCRPSMIIQGISPSPVMSDIHLVTAGFLSHPPPVGFMPSLSRKEEGNLWWAPEASTDSSFFAPAFSGVCPTFRQGTSSSLPQNSSEMHAQFFRVLFSRARDYSQALIPSQEFSGFHQRKLPRPAQNRSIEASRFLAFPL